MIDWRPFFPEANPRQLQAEVLDEVTANWDKYDNFCLELPTGVGKSAIALCLARWLHHVDPVFGTTFITTTSKDLQDQYELSYAHVGLRKLYSADNFSCSRGRDLTCSAGRKLTAITKKSCPGGCLCPYNEAKKRFIDAPFGILNLAYYLNESYYAGQIGARGAMIMDEGHTVGDAVQNFVSLEITEDKLKSYGIMVVPRADYRNGTYSIAKLKDWLESGYLKKLKDHCTAAENKVLNWLGSEEDPKYIELVSAYESANRDQCRIERVMSEMDDDWVAERDDDDNSIHITPLRPTKFMKEVLLNHNKKNIFMSATVLDPSFMIDNYDLDPARTLVIQADSPFPKDNRPVGYMPSGKIDFYDLEGSMKPLSDAVRDLLEVHQGERGIVFVSSYAQAEMLIRQVKSSRLRTHANSKGKRQLMEDHRAYSDSVIVSPSMWEGVDLKGDLSRFQIILKIPYPALSTINKKRMEKYPRWYAYATALNLIQGCGRSVRSETDIATTYILDSSWEWWYSNNHQILPMYWKESLHKIPVN